MASSFSSGHGVPGGAVRVYRWRPVACIAAIVLITLLIVWRADPALRNSFNFSLLWRNALPFILLFLVTYGLCGRIAMTLAMSATLTLFVFKINAIKELNLNAPLTPGDAVLGEQLLQNIGFFAHYTGYRSAALLCVVLMLLIALVLLWRMERRWQRPRALARLAWVALSFFALLTLFHADAPWRQLYATSAMSGYQKWNPIESARHVGFMATFVRMAQDKRVSLPPADAQSVKQFSHDHAEQLASRSTRVVPAQLPDIVVVQSEAFFDPGILKHVDFGQYVPNFEKLAHTGITGSLTTPTYGGGTIRTEFETLTAYPMLAFPAIQYPYFGLVHDWMPTVPRRLKSFGYTTTLFHPFPAEFWNRDEAMPALGFQRTYFENSFIGADRAGQFISDHALFDFVLAHLNDTERGPSYSMVITMENHGPWDRDPAGLADLLKTRSLPAGLSGRGTKEMTYYLSHVINGDMALKDFAQRLLERPRWTILLFYGDHLPALSSAFAELGFDDNEQPGDEHTRYMLLSNRPFSSGQQRDLNLHAYDLPGLMFDVAALPEDGYLAISSTIRQTRAANDAQSPETLRQIQFNAALLEVNCRHKLGLDGGCD